MYCRKKVSNNYNTCIYRFGDAGYYYWILCKTSLEAAKKECHGMRACTDIIKYLVNLGEIPNT